MKKVKKKWKVKKIAYLKDENLVDGYILINNKYIPIENFVKKGLK